MLRCLFFFFFNDTATTEIYTLSLHDALPICIAAASLIAFLCGEFVNSFVLAKMKILTRGRWLDRKSTRLNSSHLVISYAVFCLKKKKINQTLRPVTPHEPLTPDMESEHTHV